MLENLTQTIRTLPTDSPLRTTKLNELYGELAKRSHKVIEELYNNEVALPKALDQLDRLYSTLKETV